MGPHCSVNGINSYSFGCLVVLCVVVTLSVALSIIDILFLKHKK